ncbi:MAG: hypothetical protein RMJ56_17525 [Gemmataceae bacterium]|nr:hypothetical protein [Gemmata sp.]MDW8199398.1 hypothetical protein [Gemmataceae bacterium]
MAVLAPTSDRDIRSDWDKLQGAWISIAGPRPARLLIAGHRFTFEFLGGAIYMGTFELANGQMDMHIETGPAQHVGCCSQCIYRLEGGLLRWCPGKPGSSQRPSSFPDVDDPRYLSLVFRRDKR